MMNKRGFEFSFAWIFSIIIGAAVIFLAVYASTNLIKGERNIQNTLNARELEILFQPVETASAESAVSMQNIVFPSETKLDVSCSDSGEWGYSKVSVSTRQKAGKPWQEAGVGSLLNNKFIFSDKELEGKNFYLFTKPFTMPFKVGDLIFLWSKDYCFVNPIQEISDDFDSLGLENRGIEIKTSLNECTSKSVKVCFGSGGAGAFADGCDVNVDTATNRVQKEGRNVYYKGNLIYGAIFADNDNYDCLIKRIMMKAGNLAELYSDKSALIASKSQNSCSSGVNPILDTYIESANINQNEDMLETYIKFNNLYTLSDELNEFNSGLSCELWKEEFVK